MSPRSGATPGWQLADLIGTPADELEGRLGPATTRRRAGDEAWLLLEADGVELRVRCERGAPDGAAAPAPPSSADAPDAPSSGETELRVASWTATFPEGRRTLRSAAEPLGLWPACAPDVAAAEVDAPLIRRELPAPSPSSPSSSASEQGGAKGGRGEATRTLTATVRGGRITALTVFDEPPDWK